MPKKNQVLRKANIKNVGKTKPSKRHVFDSNADLFDLVFIVSSQKKIGQSLGIIIWMVEKPQSLGTTIWWYLNSMVDHHLLYQAEAFGAIPSFFSHSDPIIYNIPWKWQDNLNDIPWYAMIICRIKIFLSWWIFHDYMQNNYCMYHENMPWLPSGKHTQNYGKSPF